MLTRVDGAVWSGAPAFTPMRERLAERRNVGSTLAGPVIDNGAHVRFASRPEELWADQFGRPLGLWEPGHRVVYLQHRSDPVAWWTPELLVREPEWLRETRVDSPAAQMSWLPFVTFWQVTADMAVATRVPNGWGHNYRSEMVPAWAAVLGLDPDVDRTRIITAIRTQ